MTRGVSDESRQALRSGDKDRLRAVALAYICQRRDQGATADECCAFLDLVHNSVAPRLTELKAQGLVLELYDSRGKRVRRLTRQGCAAGVLIAAEFAPSKAPAVGDSRSAERVPNIPTFPEFGSLAPESYGVD
jgi:hypothetical protein